MRSLGGVMFAVGAALLLTRRPDGHAWSHFGRVLTLLIPAVVLYLMSISGSERTAEENGDPWRSVLLVTSMPIGLIALLELLEWVGAGSPLYAAAAFALVAVLGAIGSRRAAVPYGAMLAALAALVAWLVVWNAVLSDHSTDMFRVLLLGGGALLLAIAAMLAQNNSLGAAEVATAGGAAAVAAGVWGVIVGLFASPLDLFTGASGGSETPSRVNVALSEPHIVPFHPAPRSNLPHLLHTGGLQSFGWNLYLLVVSLGLLWVGSRARARGLGYVGAVGLLAFFVSVGAQVTTPESGGTPSTSIVGWPLALLAVGLAALGASMFYPRDST